MLKTTLAATALTTLVASSAVAETKLRVATGFPPKAAAALAAEDFVAALEKQSSGSVSGKTYHGSLLSFGETTAGVRDGVADIGYVLTAYFPAEFPHFNLISELSMIAPGPDGATNQAMAYSAAVTEYTFHHCPKCQDEFAAQNQVFTGSAASTKYGLLCTEPTDTLADLKGKRLRVAGSQWSRWATAMGGTPVSLKINEVYEGLSQGVIDCVIASAPELINFALIDVVKAVNMSAPGGVYAAAAPSNMNRDKWNSLSADDRSAVLKAAATYAASGVWRYMDQEKNGLNAVAEKGVHVSEANAEMMSASKAFLADDATTIADFYKSKYGIENAAEMIEDFRPIVDKWFALTANTASPEEYEALLWDEIFSKVNVEALGG
jgi:TRAP-type C4-dicarboxylate transport system substrate-binding protein